MKKITNTVVILTIINLVTLLVMLFFCYHNWTLDIPGMCDECMVDSGISFRLFVGFGTVLIQIVASVIMCICLHWFIKYDGNIGHVVSCVVNLFLSVVQFMLFFDEMDVTIHSQPPTKADAMALDMLLVQFDVAKILSAALIILNIMIIVFVRLWYVKQRKELLKYLNS